MKPTRFPCSGSAFAHEAGEGDFSDCADCHAAFRTGGMFCWPHGPICASCNDARADEERTEAFGRSPRKLEAPRPVLTPIRHLSAETLAECRRIANPTTPTP